MVQQSFWTVFCGNSDSLQDNLDFQSSGVLSIFNPYSCVNHALLISLNVLFIFVSLFLLFHKSFKTNFIARCHESRSCGSILCVSSVTFNCGLGLVYLGLGLWAVGKELITEKTMLPFHEWLVLLLQGTTWSLLSLTVSLKRGHLCATSMKVYLILAFSYAGFLFITSVLETVTNEAISVETVLDILSFPAGSILLFSFACSSRPCVVDGAQGTLYSPLQGHDAEANTGGENMDENVTPFAAASIFSKMTFWWMNPLMKQGKETTLEDQDIPKLRLTDRAETCYSVFWDMLNKRKQKGSSQRPPILSTLFLWQRKPLVISGFIALTKVLATSTGPFILKAFIEVAEGEDAFQYEAYALTACLFLVKCLESLSERRWYFSMRLIGLQIRSMLSVAIYQKQLRLSPAADITPGELVSYITVDAYRIGEFPYWFHQIWTTSLQMCLALLIIYYCVGMATVAAIIVVLLTVIGNMPLAKLQSKYQTGFMVEQDRMVQGVTEALENMKILKLYAWETHFMRIIERLRINEFKWLKAVLMQKGYYIVLFWSSPLFVPIATFTTCYFLGISLNASNVFTFLATIRLVQEPIRLVPDVVGAFIDAKVAIDRIMRFLEAPELERKGNIDVAKGDEQENGSIYVKASRISWETGPSTGPTLRNINLAVKPGEKVAICGEIGAGKTTLLSAILGEVPCVNGLVQMNGKLAYVSQNAWIQTGTIQENILFGSAMYPHRYKDTLAKCCLNKDLEMLPFGDETVIGERGVNLSGGQKQRVQLARALYQNADVYLLDDPFSAVDAHTATSLFNEYVMGALAGKTVLLVTHQVDFLPAFDSIVLMAGGEIIKAASYDELLASTEEFQGLVHAHDAAGTKQTSANNHSSDKTTKQEIQKIEMNEQLSMGDQLVKTEERDTGSNSLKPYIQYLKQDKGFLYFALSNFFHTCFVLGQFAQNYLLAANVQSTTGMGESAVIATYAMIGCGLVLVLVLRAWFIVLLGLGASRVMFATLLRSLFRAPISFFDSTPLGRVLSRVSSDLSIVDLDIAIKMNVAMGSIIITYFSFIVLTVLAWEMIFIIIPMIYLIVVLQRHYSAVAKSLMRINGTTKSAVASHVAETAAGATTIRAFGEETKFLCKGLDLIDKNASPFFHMFAANEWFIQRLEIICVPVLSAAALLMTVLPHSSSSAGFIGMALSYGLTLNSSLTFGFQSQCQLENMLISVERLEQYMHIPSEAPEVVEDNRPHPNWPDVGKVEICNLKVRYRPNAPLVLQGISCVIEGGYKVGIVGRTGSGKTTLVGTLFRLVEPTEGRIVVDGLDISSIGLHDLRSHFGIIPQEATLFVGSVRYNFDPLSEYTDREIWEVLEKCQLKEAVQEKPEGLSSLVVQDGSNWSMGQRQLFCLGRALLKRPKILVLDEATASIDNSTDAIIQKTIRREFADHTVITVAHRIPTVMDCTKVLALCDGRLAEYDDPEKLINQEGSLFGQLVREYWSHTANGSSSNDSLN